ncbi:MAG: polyhydroxyalkanoate synthesis repressor PhaR [Rhodospirillales bacterium]|jgi:polyhydroxyalkanoate synthesis repressor PhaR|nr:polyhydroxyalkanoate synthesis repressor PhaR [Rhodospirillales bacterium]MBT4039638.1 polyhydroxyalkanoate synthesis repressor PhaR [Rhodospirillales bacterium]MBT4625267.1 polyhydroxyalkanoate synthesis repressor PhaR [Rhodospirillales bacterium]MBT5352540.1 polyhydroxyalkanoate synthesis repressor PhaR [Rhodospirillales bacterium]MBT5519520.1 polyhydroxyalkanoate synthesis repressor PhaR [Rhodospirillales bacterium]
MANKADKSEEAPITIKKYANRRLYNTSTSSYVTLDHLAEMIKKNVDFVVYDAKSGEDITRSVLTHIIVEQESKGQNLLPTSFLRHVISFYGDSLEAVVPKYLEHTMHSFANNQDEMRDYLKDAFGGLTPFSAFEEMGKQNAAMLDSTMKMFSPFLPDANQAKKPETTGGTDAPDTTDTNEISTLRAQLDAMQRRLDDISDA